MALTLFNKRDNNASKLRIQVFRKFKPFKLEYIYRPQWFQDKTTLSL